MDADGRPQQPRRGHLAGEEDPRVEDQEPHRLAQPADGLDRDPDALEIARERLAPFGNRARFVHTVYDGIARAVRSEGFAEVQGVRSAKKVSEHVRVQLDPLDLV